MQMCMWNVCGCGNTPHSLGILESQLHQESHLSQVDPADHMGVM